MVKATCSSSLGGLLGLSLGYAADVALAAFTPIKPDLTGFVIGLTFLVSIGVGCVFGLLPAMRAAAKDPVVALRNA